MEEDRETRTDEDVEGHASKQNVDFVRLAKDEGDDVEGHVAKKDDDDDVEGHMLRNQKARNKL
jgi:hypothetical protein